MNTKPEISNLLEDLKRFGNLSDTVEWKEDTDEKTILKIYTDNNAYQIVVRLPSEERPQGYLGCQGSSRKPRAGEDWTRGRDLADGNLTQDTWHRILGDIVSYEMVKVHKKQQVV